MIALLQAKAAGLWSRSQIGNNVLAGVVVGIVALPLAMAFAIASGARPEQGLYTAIVAALLTSIFGGTRVQISGPTGAFIAVLSIITAQHGIAGLQIATLMAGVILLVFGLARLGAVIKYIPNPVIVGFTAGIAVIIFVGQWKDFLGLAPAPSGLRFHQKLWSLIEAMPTINLATTGLALLALAILTFGVRYLRRIPAPLVALIVVTVVQAVFQFKGVATIGSAFGGIPRTLPAFSIPSLDVARVLSLVGPLASAIPLCCLSAVLFVVAWNMSELRHVVRLLRGAPKVDVGIMLLTFFLTVFVDLVVAVNVGVILAALFFMRRMADSVNVEQQIEVLPGAGPADPPALPANSGVLIYSIEGPFFFGAAEKLERTLKHIQRPATTLILRMGNVPFVDATGIFAIEEIITDFKRHGAAVLLVEVRPNMRYKLDRGGVISHVGQENVIDSMEQALLRAKELQAAVQS